MSVHDRYLLHQHHEASSLFWEKHKRKLFSGDCGIPYARFTGLLTGSMSIQNIFDFGGGNDTEGITVTHNLINSASKLFFGLDPDIVNSEDDSQAQSNTDSFESVISYDVIEHLHPTSVGSCLENLFEKAEKVVILNISCVPAGKSLPDGSNHHSSIFKPETWVTLVNSLAMSHGKIFALFLTLEKNQSSLVHNIPYEWHDYAFQDFAFYPFLDKNGPVDTWYKFFNNKLESLEKMSPDERWMKTHIHYLYKRRFSITGSLKKPGQAILRYEEK